MKNIKLIVPLLLFTLLLACVPQQEKLIELTPAAYFLFIKVKIGDTTESLAEKYLGSASLAWRINEFNGIKRLSGSENLIIPLQEFRRGGLTALGFQLVPVLSYHNFTKNKSKKKLSLSADNFAAQMQYLQANSFHVLTLEQFYAFLEFGQIPQKAVVITIDDGWSSSYKIAYPILRQLGFNAALFVPTNFIHANSKKTLSWDKIREMVSDKTIDIQCQTKSHRDLTKIDPGKSYADYIKSINKEVVSSQDKIYEKLGQRANALSYPYGKTNPVVMKILAKQGYKMAFTVNRESNPFFINNLKINRRMIYGTYSLQEYITQLVIQQDFSVAKAEPVDTLQVLAKLNFSKPSEYETKKQWRTALLAWKMRLDWLKASYSTDSYLYSNTRDKIGAKNSNDLISEAEQKVRDLKLMLNNIAKSFYSSEKRYSDTEKVRRLLLRTLLYDPEHKDALDDLKNLLSNKQLIHYQVKTKDDFAKIARTLYKDSSKSVLIPLFNEGVKFSLHLKPGTNLVLPSDSAIQPSKPVLKRLCQVELTKPPNKLAEDYYSQANKQLNNDQIDSAIEKLKTAICLNPELKKAQEILDMLEKL